MCLPQLQVLPVDTPPASVSGPHGFHDLLGGLSPVDLLSQRDMAQSCAVRQGGKAWKKLVTNFSGPLPVQSHRICLNLSTKSSNLTSELLPTKEAHLR